MAQNWRRKIVILFFDFFLKKFQPTLNVDFEVDFNDVIIGRFDQ